MGWKIKLLECKCREWMSYFYDISNAGGNVANGDVVRCLNDL